jgi:hypothetical protein
VIYSVEAHSTQISSNNALKVMVFCFQTPKCGKNFGSDEPHTDLNLMERRGFFVSDTTVAEAQMSDGESKLYGKFLCFRVAAVYLLQHTEFWFRDRVFQSTAMQRAVIRGIAEAVAPPLRLFGRLLDSAGVMLEGSSAYVERRTFISLLAVMRKAEWMFDTCALVDRFGRFASFKGKSPRVGKGSFVAPNASIVGDVSIGPGTTVWYGAVVRGTNLASVFGFCFVWVLIKPPRMHR